MPTPTLINVYITFNIIKRLAKKMKGEVGPGGIDATAWQNYML